MVEGASCACRKNDRFCDNGMAPYGEVLRRPEERKDPARIYVNGLRVAEETDFLFSYNITAPAMDCAWWLCLTPCERSCQGFSMELTSLFATSANTS
jgi:hypothetical protein